MGFHSLCSSWAPEHHVPAVWGSFLSNIRAYVRACLRPPSLLLPVSVLRPLAPWSAWFCLCLLPSFSQVGLLSVCTSYVILRPSAGASRWIICSQFSPFVSRRLNGHTPRLATGGAGLTGETMVPEAVSNFSITNFMFKRSMLQLGFEVWLLIPCLSAFY